jgi:signal transduction histidine kinase
MAAVSPDSSDPGSADSGNAVSGNAVSAGTSPSALAAGGVTALVGGAGLGLALAVTPAGAVGLVSTGGGAGLAVTAAAVAYAAHQLRAARRSRARAVGLEARLRGLERDVTQVERIRAEAQAARRSAREAADDRARLEADAAALASATLPAAFGQVRAGESADHVLAQAARPASGVLRGLLDGCVTEVAGAEQRSATALAACASAAARIQAQSTRMLAELREMEHRHGDSKVFADLIELDHRASQLGRLADSVALLAGGRSGRRWTRPIPMESLLRGAMGRIEAYQRVRLHSTSTAAVSGYAAEGVMHALAELLDNATAFSTYGSEVHVYVEDEDAGLIITIEDSGLGMRRRERDRAEDLVAVARDLSTLPGTRLGLAVVGKVAGRYGLTVSFRPSSRGGTGVVLLIPRKLISAARPDAEPDRIADSGGTGPGVRGWFPREAECLPAGLGPGGAPGGSGSGQAISGQAFSEQAFPEDHGLPSWAQPGDGHAADGDLPVRRPGQTLAAAARERAAMTGDEGESRSRTPAETGVRFAAFRSAAAAAGAGGGTAGDRQQGQGRRREGEDDDHD